MVYEFKNQLIENEILSQLIAPGTPQQNCVAERRNLTLLDMMRSMSSYSSLPISFWGYALQTAVYILNIVLEELLVDEIRPISKVVVEQEEKRPMIKINHYHYQDVVGGK